MSSKRSRLLMVLFIGCAAALNVMSHNRIDLAANTYESAFAELNSPEATTSPPLRKRLIREGFLSDPSSALPFVLRKLWANPSSDSFADRHVQEMGRCTARAILAEMPVHLQEELAAMKPDSALRTSGLLQAMGSFRTPLALERLEEALSDQRISGLKMALHDGWQLRVCDVAYNTIVHRLKLSQLRSPLGSHHSYEQRDRWIQRLRDWLQENAAFAATCFSSTNDADAF